MPIITLGITDQAVEEMKRLVAETGLKDQADVLRRGLTLLRIHVREASRGRRVVVMDGGMEAETITLPFAVRPQPTQESSP